MFNTVVSWIQDKTFEKEILHPPVQICGSSYLSPSQSTLLLRPLTCKNHLQAEVSRAGCRLTWYAAIFHSASFIAVSQNRADESGSPKMRSPFQKSRRKSILPSLGIYDQVNVVQDFYLTVFSSPVKGLYARRSTCDVLSAQGKIASSWPFMDRRCSVAKFVPRSATAVSIPGKRWSFEAACNSALCLRFSLHHGQR